MDELPFEVQRLESTEVGKGPRIFVVCNAQISREVFIALIAVWGGKDAKKLTAADLAWAANRVEVVNGKPAIRLKSSADRSTGQDLADGLTVLFANEEVVRDLRAIFDASDPTRN